MLMLKNLNRDEELFMSKKIKNNCVIEFISKHKILFLCISICVAIVCSLPFVINNVGAEEKTADEVFVKRDMMMDNSESNPYILDSVDDFIALQEFSKTNDCYGLYFAVGDVLKNNRLTYSEDEEDEEGSEAGGITYNLNLVGTIVLEDGTKTEFIGIGQNYALPFRGNIIFNGITARVDTPLFCFLGSGASITELHLFGNIIPDKLNSVVTSNATLGFLAGMAILDGEKPLNISTVSMSHNSTITGTTKSVGGLIGTVIGNPNGNAKTYEGNNINSYTTHFVLNLDKITIPDEIDLLSTGYATSTYNVKPGAKGTLPNNYPGYTGGIVGDIISYGQTGGYYIDVNFTGTTLVKGKISSTKMGAGGIIGHIGQKVCVKFDGDVDVSQLTEVISGNALVYKGAVIGSIDRYAVAYMTNGYQVIRPIIEDLKTLNEVDTDLNNSLAGFIYKNTTEDFFEKTVKISGEGTKDNPYILGSGEDVQRLSVLLCTTGNYGIWFEPAQNKWGSWFDVPEEYLTSAASVRDYIRKSHFIITNNIDLNERNILRLNRDKGAKFAGSIIGQSGSYNDGNIYPTLTLNNIEWQATSALIGYAEGRIIDGEPVACEYKNFNLKGNVESRTTVSGLINDLEHTNTAYSDYIFENINMNLDIKQKNLANYNLSGFINVANYRNVTTNLQKGLELTFKDINFNGSLIANSDGTSGGGTLVYVIYPPGNDMTNSEDINRFVINVDNYNFSGEIKCTSTKGMYVSGMIGMISNTANNYKTLPIAGVNINVVKRAILNIKDVTFKDVTVTNGDGSGTLSGILGYSWDNAETYIKNLVLKNVTYDTMKGPGALLLYTNSSIIETDGLTYDNVRIIRRGDGGSQFNSAMLWNNYSAIFTLKNHNVINSKVLFNNKRHYFYENATEYSSYNGNAYIDYHGLYSLEGNDPDGEKYTAVNSYESPYIYTDIATETATDYKDYSYKGTRMQYNVISNMDGQFVQGTGTIEDPFIINNEAKLVLFSNVHTLSMAKVDYFLKYYKDIENIFADDELTTLSFLEKRAKMCERILTGVYVFARSMDLSEYSYYTANNCTGSYYGFDAYSYSGKSELTENELREYCSNAIKVLESESTVGGLTLENVNNNKPDIHFDATKVANGAMASTTANGNDGWNKPCSNAGIHMDMQSGLFGPITGGGTYNGDYVRGNVRINNLKFSGELAGRNYNEYTGGGAFLITGCCSGRYSAVYKSTVDIKNIDFQNAFITNRIATAPTWNYGNGLLIDTINNGNVNISNIKILKNDDNSANVRADALIGYQFGTSTKTIFRNIDLNAVIDPGTLSKSTEIIDGEEVVKVNIDTTEVETKWRTPGQAGYDTYGYGFKYGYFFYHLKEGAAIYWYDVGEDIVTPGRFNINDVNDPDYANRKQLVQNKVLLNNVQKYAYKVVNVDVNPESVNIIHGSGTKEDPYIIDKLGQLITLSNFIKYEGDIIDYSTWYVGEIDDYTGYVDYDADTWEDSTNLLYQYRKVSDTEDNRLQAVKKLSSSYYKIVTDIDFSDPTSPFSDAALNFNGIGTTTYPFSGGFIGELKGDGTYPNIVFGSSDENYLTTFGFVQFGKGIFVQNLNFINGYEYAEDFDLDKGDYVYTKTNVVNRIYLSDTSTVAGMVAANIIGGDNIIDNVAVDNQIQKKTQGGSNFKLGGYVGYLKRGTLRVSGIDNNTFANLRIGIGNAMDNVNYSTAVNKYISAIVGRVEAAYIVYFDEDNPLPNDKISIDCEYKTNVDSDGNIISEVSDIQYYNKYGVPCNRDFDIINMSYLDTIDRIKVIKDEREQKDGTLIAKIENEDQLFLYSLALGSGALSSTDGNTTSHPYGINASCKKFYDEFESWLENENANKADDKKIILNELYNFPAVFKYFDFTGLDKSYLDTIHSGYSMLNIVNGTYQSDGIHRTTYMLSKENSVYDMSKFGSDFVGIGMRVEPGYSEWDNTATVSMCANFDGNGNTIRIDIKKTGMAGLFPILNAQYSNNYNAPFVIKNFTLEGSVEQIPVTTGNLTNTATAGVVGYIRYGFFMFDNIKLQNLKIKNKIENNEHSYVAGIMGYNGWGGYGIKFKNITIGDKNSNDPENVLIDNYESKAGAGGLFVATNYMYAENINVYNTTIKSGAHVGGLAAGVTPNNGNYSSKINHVNIFDSTFETRVATGGVGSAFGYLSGNNTVSQYVAIHDINVKDNNLIAPEGNTMIGKIAGFHSSVYYSKKEILKLTDKNSDDFTGPTSDVIWNCLNTSDYEDCDYIYHNEFYELEKAEELYGIDRTKVDENGNLIVRYDECLEDNLFTYDYNSDGIKEGVDLITSTDMTDNTIIKWSSDSGTLENVINSVLNTLTNGTGMLNDKINDKISVTVESLQVKDGVVSAREDGSETISITYRDGEFIVTNNNKYDTFEKTDAKTGVHTPGTFSVVHVKYSIGNGTFTEDIAIPIFVSNMVNVDIYSKLLIGEEYDTEILRAIERTSSDIQVTTKDSSYTVYTEFMYSSNRIDFDEELYMNKGFRLYDSPDPYIAVGTKLTLIDLTFEDNPKTYYYEVKVSDTFIPLEWFKDEKGVNYKERNLNILDRNKNGLPQYSSYTTMFVNQRTFKKYNRGVEKYLLFVDCTKVEQVGNESQFSPFIMDGVETGQDDVLNKEVFYIKYRTYNTLSTYNGRRIGFVDDSVITDGEINKEKQLNVKVDFTDEATDYYWNSIKPYDYNNKGKYLEVAIYLKNESGEKVMLPSGTRIKYGDSQTVYEAVKNTSAIFYYKDGVEDGYELMTKIRNTTTTVDFTLDFTYAKMEKLPSGNYAVCFDLVRTTNKDFPMGDDIVDTIESNPIGVTANAEYGFRIDTYGKDTLAFNLADIIEGQVLEVDFGVMLNSTLPVSIAENKKATVKFVLYKKDEVTGNYVEYKDLSDLELTDIELEIFYNNVIENVKLDEGNYEYVFNGISGKEEEAVEASCKLRFPYNADINNYKLQAEMYIDGYKQASDYFVVNISDITH